MQPAGQTAGSVRPVGASGRCWSEGGGVHGQTVVGAAQSVEGRLADAEADGARGAVAEDHLEVLVRAAEIVAAVARVRRVRVGPRRLRRIDAGGRGALREADRVVVPA